jgi:hypothetical protein
MNLDQVTEQIETLNSYVNKYYNCDRTNGNELSLYLQKITAILYYLETARSQIHDQYETEVFNLVKDGSSVARAVNEANVKHPMMYQLRRIMSAGYRIADAIRTNISYLKSEKQHTPQ